MNFAIYANFVFFFFYLNNLRVCAAQIALSEILSQKKNSKNIDN